MKTPGIHSASMSDPNPDRKTPALFLDRDGVLIENRPGYVKSWDDVEIIPSSVTAGRILTEAGVPMVIVSNQAGIGRGVVSFEVARKLYDQMIDAYRDQGVAIVAGYMCPHAPEEGCTCRKPLPGMLVQAALEHHLDLASSVMVGDALRDLQAADAAGATGMLVRSGMGAEQEQQVVSLGAGRWKVFDNLLEAVPAILTHVKGIR